MAGLAFRSALLGGSAVVLALGLGGAASAQTRAVTATAAADAAEVSEVIVTGSFIAGTPKDAAIPVSVISQQDVAKQGSPSALDLIRNLPIVGSNLGETNSASTLAQGRLGGGTINLRGLGAQRTLVLLNGTRFAGYTSDTNLLPISAIGRIEILRDGAAATYGSDAIGGVVNFITRAGFTGLEVQADYRGVPGAKGDYTASGLYGWSKDTTNLLVSVGYQHRSELSSTDRSWALKPYLVNPAQWSVLGNPGTWSIRGTVNNAPATIGIAVDANCGALGSTPGFTGTTPACYFGPVASDNIVEDQDQYQVYAEFNARVGDTAKFHAEALYSKTSVPHIRFPAGYAPTSGPNGPGSVNVYSVPASNPGFNTFLTQTGNAGLIGRATGALATLWRPVGSGGNPVTGGLGGQVGSRDYDELHISADLSGDLPFAGVGYDVRATFIRETQEQRTTDILIDRIQRGLNGLGGANCTGTTPGANGCQYLNPFSNAYPNNPAVGATNPGFVAANANPASLVGWLYDTQIFLQTQNTFVADAVLHGKLPFELPGGQPGWAAGMQYRNVQTYARPGNDLYDSRVTPCPVVGVTTCTLKTGPYMFLGQTIPTNLAQDVYAIFGELSIPLTNSIAGQLSLRYENYGGLTGSTTNPEFRAKWQVVDWLALRGSVGTSFRGPTSTNVAPTGVTALAGIIAAGGAFKSLDLFGNPAVGPEKAFSYSLGAIVRAGGLTGTVDYWSYRLDNQIVTVPGNIIATSVGGVGNGSQAVNCASPLRNLITFDNNNTCTQGVTVGNNIARVRSDTTNGPQVRTDGVDVDVNYLMPSLWNGDLNLGASASYVFHYKQAPFIYAGVTVSPAFDAVGFGNYDRLPGSIPQWRGQFYANYSRGPHNLRWTIQYVDGVTDNRGPTVVQTGSSPNCTVANAKAGTATNCQLATYGLEAKPYIEHDVTYRVELPWQSTLTLSVLNIFDREPPAAQLAFDYDPLIGNPLGRTWKVGVKKRF
jgi:outer membrane receptor protein involved in Fe transport